MPKKWLTLGEVAQKTRTSQKELRHQLDTGKFPAPDRPTEGPLWSSQTATPTMRRTPRDGYVMSSARQVLHLYDEVLYWALQHGHANIPQDAVGRRTRANGEPFRLGGRVSSLRYAYGLGRVTPEQVAMFESIPGWTWRHWDSVWHERCSDVLSRFPDELTAHDRVWIRSQRLRWDLLPEDRQARLEAVPDIFESRHSRVNEFVDAVEAWLAEHPTRTAFSLSYSDSVVVDGVTIPVGRRASYYRRRYLGLEGPSRKQLSDEDVAAIEALPGWVWENSQTSVAPVRRSTAEKARRR